MNTDYETVLNRVRKIVGRKGWKREGDDFYRLYSPKEWNGYCVEVDFVIDGVSLWIMRDMNIPGIRFAGKRKALHFLAHVKDKEDLLCKIKAEFTIQAALRKG